MQMESNVSPENIHQALVVSHGDREIIVRRNDQPERQPKMTSTVRMLIINVHGDDPEVIHASFRTISK